MRTLHVGLRVADLERSLAFYTSLGFEVVGRVPETELGQLTMLKLPQDEFVTIELVHDPARGDVVPEGFSHLVVQVEALRAFARTLAAAGVRVESPAYPDDSEDFLTAWLTDPDGYRLELVQWPSGHPQGMTRADFEHPVVSNTYGLSCPRCKRPFSSDNADHLADALLAHLKADHGHAPPREHVLARVERHNPTS